MGKQQALSKWTFYIFVQYSLVLNLKYIVQIGFFQTNDGKTTLSFQKFCTMNWVSNTLHKYLKRSYVKFWSRGEQVGKIVDTEEKEKLPISIYILRAIVKWQKWTLSKHPWNSWYWSLKRSQVLVRIPISTYTCINDCLNVIETILFQSFQALHALHFL